MWSLAVVLSLWQSDCNRMDSYRVSTVDVPESPLSALQEVRDSRCDVTPCIVKKNDGVLYHQVS